MDLVMNLFGIGVALALVVILMAFVGRDRH